MLGLEQKTQKKNELDVRYNHNSREKFQKSFIKKERKCMINIQTR